MKTAIIGVLVSLVAFFTPIKGLLVIMGGMVLSDTVFAMYVAYTMGDGWNSITSHRFFNIAPKLLFYEGSIVMAFLIDFYICSGGLFGIEYFGSKIVTVAFASNEIKSINETYVKKYKKSLYVVFKEYLEMAKQLKKDIAELIDK